MSLQARMFISDDSGQGGGSKIPVGIHQGTVVFNGLTTDTGWTDINFAMTTNGKVLHKRLFEPTGSSPMDGETIQEAYDREVKRNLRHIADLIGALLGNEVLSTFEAPTYKEFVAKAQALLQGVKGVAVNLKVVPDGKEGKYPDVPRYGLYVERYTPGSETRLKFSNKEIEAIQLMEQKRAVKSGDGSLSTEDLESLV